MESVKIQSQNGRSVTREATILNSITQALQAPAGRKLRKALSWVSGTGLVIVIAGVATGLIPPPKGALADSSRVVSIYFDGQKRVITTSAPTVKQSLQEAGVAVGQNDLVEPGLDAEISSGFFNVNVFRSRPVLVSENGTEVIVHTALQSPRLIAEKAGLKTYQEDNYELVSIQDVADTGVVGQKVVITRATPVIIQSDGQTLTVRTQQKTVGGLLDERDVALGPEDTAEPGRNTPITPNLTVKINRVTAVVQKETTTIGRQTETVRDDSLEIGTTKVEAEGRDGTKAATYRVHYQNGIEQSRELISEQVTLEPVTKVVRVGTKIIYSSNPVELGRQMAAEKGWVGSQWTALYNLWERESGWNPDARNYWSGACGIPQAYPCSKITDKSTAGQLRWGLNYIQGRYGSPAAAWAYWQQHHSY